MSDATTRGTVEAVWRLESTRLIGSLTRVVRDVGLAEDLAQDALVAALEQWPTNGVPDNPAAWLMTTARRRAVDQFRRRTRRDELYALVALDQEDVMADPHLVVDHVEDDVLRLMFICCHPALTPDAQATLTLRLVGGLTSREIARSYLTKEATVAQRVSRAKRTLTETGAALEEPDATQRAERLTSVLKVVYLVFTEGYAASAGDDWMRPALCMEALRLGRILTGLAPLAPEVHGLVSLMELQASRLASRSDATGTPVLLADQDRSAWNPWHLRRGLEALDRAVRLSLTPGAYELQAAIAACHARARSLEQTDWVRVAALYEDLARLTRSAVVELNRAVALGMARGPQAGLTLVDQLVDHPALRSYHLLPSVRGDLLQRLGRYDEAAGEFERAAGLSRNTRERTLLAERARAARSADS